MSYILDALKKSDQQRPPGPIPDLFTEHGPQPPAPRRPTRATVVVAAFLVVAAIIFGIWIGAGPRGVGSNRPPAAASPPQPAAPPAALTVPRPAPPSAAMAPVRAVVSGGAPGSVGTRSQPPASPQPRQALPAPVSVPVPPAAPVATPASVPASASAVPLPAIETPPPERIASALEPTPTGTPPSVDTPEATPAAPPASPSPDPTPPADGRVLELSELPASVRAELPKLVVSGHVWSEESSLRLLSIDDRLLHEGAEIAPGLRLLEITPSGAVVTFKGWRFRTVVGQP